MGLSTVPPYCLSPHCLANTKHWIPNRISVVLPWSQDMLLYLHRCLTTCLGYYQPGKPTWAFCSEFLLGFGFTFVNVLVHPSKLPLHTQSSLGLRGVCRHGLPLGWLKERVTIYNYMYTRSGLRVVQALGAHDFSVLLMSPLGMDIAKRGKSMPAVGTDTVI